MDVSAVGFRIQATGRRVTGGGPYFATMIDIELRKG
jgi:hypothetical protein